MNKKYIAILLLSCLFLTSFMGTFVTAAERPDWALDPEGSTNVAEDYELYEEETIEFTNWYEDPSEIVNVWYQYWISPKDCDEDGSCNAIIGIAYLNFSEQISDDYAQDFEDALDTWGDNLEDITDEVPYARFAYMLNMSYSGVEALMGFCVYESLKHATIFVSASNLPSSSASSGDIGVAGEVSTAMKDLMVASGEAAQSALGMIPGYNVLLTIGILGAVSAVIIYRKKKLE